MTISGKSLIAGQWLGDTSHGFIAQDAANNKPLSSVYAETSIEDLDTAIVRAHEAFGEFSQASAEQRANFLTTIGDQIIALGDELIVTASAETGLPEARITGERGRTVGQLNLFANLLLNEEYPSAIEKANPTREPLPKPDTRLGYLPLGVVGVFGASNFPLAFSTAGGDTASALAAGCPVVMKAHVAHPGTAELVAQAIDKAIEICGLNKGVFSLIQGADYGLATHLVKHRYVKAVGFTGSERVGMILQAQINERAEPIPFYGELGSVNPQFLLPEQLSNNGAEMAANLVGSLMMGVGQFCTSPGLWVTTNSRGYEGFEASAIKHITEQASGVMLTASINSSYQESIEKWQKLDGVSCLALGQKSKSYHGQAALFSCDLATFIKHEALQEEVFGPSALIVRCENEVETLQLISLLKGSLTASIHAQGDDLAFARTVSLQLAHKVGRLIFNQMPTGVEVCATMNHGGPFPASTDIKSTSVGSKAIERFRRPICYQNMPQALLPAALID